MSQKSGQNPVIDRKADATRYIHLYHIYLQNQEIIQTRPTHQKTSTKNAIITPNKKKRREISQQRTNRNKLHKVRKQPQTKYANRS